MIATNWQDKVNSFAGKNNLHRSINIHLLDLISELGEVAKEVLLACNYGTQPLEIDSKHNFSTELGDALYSLCLLATAADVDLDTALDDVLTKYEKRWREKGHIGSNSE